MAKRNLPFGGATPMEPGERDRLVTIQQRPSTDAVDDAGAPFDGTWTTLASKCWMSKHDMGQNERFAANQMSSPADTRWEMGYRSDMDPELVDVVKLRRLLFHDRVYDIVSASMIGRKDGIELITLSKTS